jgi:hypothetical protein
MVVAAMFFAMLTMPPVRVSNSIKNNCLFVIVLAKALPPPVSFAF